MTSGGLNMVAIPQIPAGKLSTEVEFKARPSSPVMPSPSPEGTIGEAIRPPIYAAEQHSTWAELFKRQSAILKGRVCDEYLAGRELMNYPSDRVPSLAELSRSLQKATGWQVIRVEGYVPENIFLNCSRINAFRVPTSFGTQPNWSTLPRQTCFTILWAICHSLRILVLRHFFMPMGWQEVLPRPTKKWLGWGAFTGLPLNSG